MEGKYWSLIGLCGIVALLCMGDKKANSMSGIKKRKSRRLYYIYEGKTINREQVNEAKRLAKAGYGTLYAAWAYTADEARQSIRQGRAERVSGLGAVRYEQISGNILEEGFTVKYKNKMAKVIRTLRGRDHPRVLIKYLKSGKEEFAIINDVLLPVERKEGWWYYGGVRKYPDYDYKGKERVAELGYKGYDEEGAINATIKNIEKFQGKPAFVYATYTGIKSAHIRPPYGQQYYRVNSDGSVDFVKYSKGITTEERIRNPKPIMFNGFEDLTVYHGTNRNIEEFDYQKAYKQRGREFGIEKALYFTENPDIAKGYAYSNINASLDKCVANEVRGANSKRLFKLILNHGYRKGWGDFTKGFSNTDKAIESIQKEGNDPNDIGDVTQYVRESKNIPELQESALDMFSTSTNPELPEWLIESAKNIGIRSIPSNPKVLKASISDNAKIKNLGKTTITKLKKQVSMARQQGYDGVKYVTEESVEGEPEIAMFNTKYISKPIVLHGLSLSKESESLPPILGWVGGKTKLADKIISMMPPHKVYVEPFLGGGSVFFKKPLAEVNVINDLDKDLMNFYKGVRDGSCEKIRACKLPKNRTEFDRAVDNKSKDICSYLGVNKAGYGGKMKRITYSNRQRKCNAVNFKSKCNMYKEKLKQAKMQNKNYLDVIKENDSKDTLAYIDPPYIDVTEKLYNHNEINPANVAKVVKSMKGKAIISYDNIPEVRKAFQGLNIHKINHKYHINGGDKKVKELLITNF